LDVSVQLDHASAFERRRYFDQPYFADIAFHSLIGTVPALKPRDGLAGRHTGDTKKVCTQPNA
jgi:hypothetical protein